MHASLSTPGAARRGVFACQRECRTAARRPATTKGKRRKGKKEGEKRERGERGEEGKITGKTRDGIQMRSPSEMKREVRGAPSDRTNIGASSPIGRANNEPAALGREQVDSACRVPDYVCTRVHARTRVRLSLVHTPSSPSPLPPPPTSRFLRRGLTSPDAAVSSRDLRSILRQPPPGLSYKSKLRAIPSADHR